MFQAGGIFGINRKNETICLCVRNTFNPAGDLSAGLTLFTILAFFVAFQFFIIYKTVCNAQQELRQMRRKSEIESVHFMTMPRLTNRRSPSFSELRQQPDIVGTTLTSFTGSNLTKTEISDMYEELPLQYQISSIDEEPSDEDLGDHEEWVLNNNEVTNGKSRSVDENFLSTNRDIKPRERIDSSSSYNNAEKLFRLIFQDPTTMGEGDLVDCNENDDKKKQKKKSMFQAVKSSIWMRQNSSANSLLDSSEGKDTSESVKFGSKKNSDPGEMISLAKQTIHRKTSGPSTSTAQGLEARNRMKMSLYDMETGPKNPSITDDAPQIRTSAWNDNFNGILRKDSVASQHAPIGPEEAKMIQARQRRRVAVSFHSHTTNPSNNQVITTSSNNNADDNTFA